MNIHRVLLAGLLPLLNACASWSPPSAEHLARQPVLVYPELPTAGQDYIYKMSASVPVAVTVLADGSALAAPASHTLEARLARDLYLYRDWASDDGRTWVRREALIQGRLDVTLPAYESPGPGLMHLTITRGQQ